ncbi:MAG: putative membrane protein [Planctomycetota bacterium]|jgi:uncharacterized membrane protein
MPKIQKLLQRLAWCCFPVFLVCAIVSAIAGAFLIWRTGGGAFYESVTRVFLTAFLLTVITGLLISGVRTMVGELSDGGNG